MSFGGHVLDMMNRSKQNRALIMNRRNRTAKIRQQYINHKQGKMADGKEITPEELREIRDTIRKKLERERRMEMWTTGITVALIICALLILVILFF